ncbi:MAG: alpha/beta hydrolase [Spirochaetaceae bacterium]|jgi:acetyl esterase/lipase|nr:alpha/beta hydrolase [Spirochaetaceae bacterium]
MKLNSGMFFKITAASSLLAAILFLGACSSDIEQPDPNLNIAYGTASPAQVLDLFLPEDSGGGNPADTVVLYIHGGAWVTGDKADSPVDEIRRIAAAKGCVAASMNYRLITMANNTVHCDDMLNDIDLAIRCIKDRTASLGLGINKLVLVGVSAGAHLSLLYAYQHAEGDSPAPIPIVLCISLSGPTDFTDPAWYTGMPVDPVIPSIQDDLKFPLISALTGEQFTPDDIQAMQEDSIDAGKRDALLKISPVHHVTGKVPTTILAHGQKDGIVPFSNAERLKAKLDDAGVAPVPPKDRLTVFPNSGHTLAGDPDKLEVLFDVINEYIGNL